MGWIYRFAFPNGKNYVGQTKRKRISDRWRAHKNRAFNKSEKACWKFYRAIRKYGWKNIKKEVLAEVPDHLMNQYETIFIGAYDCYKNGYNLTKGGDLNPMSDPKVRKRLSRTCSAPEHKAATSKRIKALHADPEWKTKWLETHKASHTTEQHRAENAERSKVVWAKEKAAGKDRGAGIKAALNDPNYKAKLEAKKATPEYQAMQQARKQKIRATYARKAAERTGSQ